MTNRISKPPDYNPGTPAASGPAPAAPPAPPSLLASPIPLILIGAAVAFAALFAFDGPISTAADRFFQTTGGDFRRELLALQQFGQGTISVLIAIAIFLLDPRRRRRLLDWAAAAAIAGTTTYLIKCLAGRIRPSEVEAAATLGAAPDPAAASPSAHQFIWAFGHYTQTLKDGTTRTLSPWGSHYILESFPSRHSTFAFICATFLCLLYPRLRPLALALATVVCLMRVLTHAHWPTDVIAGAAIGSVTTLIVARHYWGVRALDWFWIRFVNPKAEPALDRLLRG